MRLSTIARYGLRAMIDLAEHYDGGFVRLSEIAERQGISLRYLENIMSRLVAANLVISSRGRRGGFKLAKAPSEITVLEVIEPLEQTLSPVPCLDTPDYCDRVDSCAAKALWEEVKLEILKILGNKTLADLAALANELENKESD